VPTKEDNSNARSVDQTFNVFGVLLNFLVTPVETGHEVSFFKGILPPGVVIPLHSHAEPEVFYVLEGSLEVYRESGQPQGWSTIQPGGVLAIPGNVKHALRNTSSTPTTVLLVTQEELYNFFRSSSLQLPNITTGWARPKRTQQSVSPLANRIQA
jgi:quercetin dioxygenase-like cupin family protein